MCTSAESIEVVCPDCTSHDWRQPFPDRAAAVRWLDSHADRHGHEAAHIVEDPRS